MPASHRTKVLLTLAGAGVFIIGIFAYSFYSAWNRFATEDRLSGTFHPVISGIEEFRSATGSLPTNLASLVPRYVPQIPAAPVADSVEYRILPDGTNWQLSVRSRITGAPRVFVNRSSGEFSGDEERRAIERFHGWRGFNE